MKDLNKIDLCARLPYGVVVTTTMKTVNNSGKCLGSESLTEKMTHGILENFMDFGVKTMPHLFHISCLTKPITVNGRTFVPIEEMCRILYDHDDKTRYRISITDVFSLCEARNGESVYVLNDYTKIDYWIIELFNKWHINYRLPEGEYIQVTEEFNPYKYSVMNRNDFEMPTPCIHCGETFDLNDGYVSEKWHPNTTICQKCHEEEELEMEEDERWVNINVDMTNALFGLFEEESLNERLDDQNRNLIEKIYLRLHTGT